MQDGGVIIQNINNNQFILNNYIQEEKQKNKKLVYISGGGPIGLYCGLELLKTNKFIVIISEQRKAYTRKQIFFLQNTIQFNSYNNLSSNIKKELERVGCNIGIPFITRTDNCNKYVNKYDILNDINSKFISLNVYKLEEILFTEFIINGGIMIKPDLSIDIINNPNAFKNKNINNKLVYKYNIDKNRIECIEGCNYYNNPNIKIDGKLIDYIIDSEGLNSSIRINLLNNQRIYLTYKKNNESSSSFGELVESNESNILSYGLLIFIDISKLSNIFLDRINDSKNESFGYSKFNDNVIKNINSNIEKNHYIQQNRYRFFATNIDKYSQYYFYLNNIKSNNNSFYASIMLSINEYNYIKDILQNNDFTINDINKSNIDKYNYFELLLFSCFNFYNLINTNIEFLYELIDACTFNIFPVQLFYTNDIISKKLNDNSGEKTLESFINSPSPAVFSIGDSILGVNYFSGSGLNYGMNSVNILKNILINEEDNINIKIEKYNNILKNKSLRYNLINSINTLIDFDKINIKYIIENNFSFTESDPDIIKINRIYPLDINKLPNNLYNRLINNCNFSLNDISPNNQLNIDLSQDINNLCNIFIEKFCFNINNIENYNHSFNSLYFHNIKQYLLKKSYNNVFKLYLLLNSLSPFILSNMNNNKEIIKSNKLSIDNILNISNFNISNKNYIVTNNNNDLIIQDILSYNYKNLSLEPGEIFIDPYDNHKKIFTDLITNIFLKSDESIYNTLNLINSKFNTMIQEYIKFKNLPNNSIIFIYKGGNVIRILFESYQLNIGTHFSKLFNEAFSSNFSRSDMDFEIIINKSVFNNINFNQIKEEIIKDMNKLSYNILSEIRIELYKDLDKYIDFYKLIPRLQKIYLIESLNKLNKLNDKIVFLNILFNNIYSNYNSDISSERYDIHIINNNDSSIKIGNIPNYYNNLLDKNNFYISINETISDFNLYRIKINFNCQYSDINDKNNNINNINLPGEFIDVTISKKDKIFIYENDIINYNFNKLDTKLVFTSYTLEYFINELINIISTTKDNKSNKRLNRLLLLCFIQSYIIDGNKITKNLYNFINLILKNIQSNNIIDIQNNIYSGYVLFYNKLLKNNSNNYKFIDDCLIIFTQLVSIIKNNKKFNLYDIIHLGGNIYKDKYLKYKTKYLKLLK